MAINYDTMRGVAARLITENGTPADIVREESTGYDPLTDTDVMTVVRVPTHVAMTRLNQGVDDTDWQSLNLTYELGRVSKVYISAGDLPAGFEPIPGDRLEIGGAVWTVKGNNPVRPDNAPVLHILFVVKGAV